MNLHTRASSIAVACLSLKKLLFAATMAALVAAGIALVAIGIVPLPSRSATGSGGAAAFAVPAGAGPAPKLGASAPDFSLASPDGTSVRLSDLQGKTVVLNFWATWCGPCKKEFPLLSKLYQHDSAHDLVVLGVDVQEDPGQVSNFAHQFGATFPIVVDVHGDAVGGYRLIGLPSTFFIDPHGVLRAEQLGPLTQQSLDRNLRQAGFTPSPR